MTGGHDPDAYVELGSFTKVLTGTVLEVLAARRVVSLDDPVERWLSAAAGTGVTLRHLADHTFGLPRLPPDSGLFNPYRDFTRARLDELVGRLDSLVTARPGEREEYSNLGYAVLGAALTAAAGGSYEELVVDHVLAPLGLTARAVTAVPPMDQRLLASSRLGRPSKPWDLTGAILPAGGMWATTRTAARLLTGLVVDKTLGEPALTWRRVGDGERPLTYHNGATRKSRIFAGAVSDGRWVVVHRLSGSVKATDRAGVDELRAAAESSSALGSAGP
ncbi:D-alanyl-D-alanine-carboxypeptidase / D-alanyl-D-alanine-endopeptidase [Streptomyces sp. yr375]|uniref:serine hydrolase domain-containing protein n=1 Tax=Streptomyces sp. yr375 TaxID=1761906 RepID=UPI0008D36566|nr:serine hydrolase domain-containing protein [Streptomyces sp. yr375]SER00351.1 D-alanyl-D-alanine-carboxypeptidase / D-alanyl-D-alanine-endopeptidase [Streptomyces sp. yr375]